MFGGPRGSRDIHHSLPRDRCGRGSAAGDESMESKWISLERMGSGGHHGELGMKRTVSVAVI